MKPAAIARERLRGHWEKAVTVQLLLILAALGLLSAELGVLLLLDIPAIEVIHAAELLKNPSLWPHALLLCGIALLDLLLFSPLHLGQAGFYARLAADAPIPPRALGTYYHARAYGKAVAWRLAIWWRTLLWGLLSYLPAMAILAFGEVLRTGAPTPLQDVSRLLCNVFGLFGLMAGFLIHQLILLRYMPAPYLIARGMPVRAALRTSRRIMRGRTGETAWFYLGFSGWLFASLLVIPYFYAAPLFQTARAGLAGQYLADTAPDPTPSRHHKRAAAKVPAPSR